MTKAIGSGEIDLLGPVTNMELYNEAKVFHKSMLLVKLRKNQNRNKLLEVQIHFKSVRGFFFPLLFSRLGYVRIRYWYI